MVITVLELNTYIYKIPSGAVHQPDVEHTVIQHPLPIAHSLFQVITVSQ